MTRSEILEFVKRNPMSFMATVENGEPRVRGMGIPVVDEKGLVFGTGTGKQVCRQLLANPSVELCFWSQEERTQIRLRGKMEIVNDPDLLRHIVETVFTFLKPVVEKHGWESLTLFRFPKGKALLWSAQDPAAVSTAECEF
jgi:uncharacterized pyridoxamine 5'-phosphate oxidase family protein